ncbi:MFS transporter [Streptosporangium sandarakinum]
MGYLSLLRVPYVVRLLLGSLVGRLPSAMAAVAIPLALRENGAGYAFVGVAAGAFAVAAAVGGPVLGRMVDRAGQTRVLLPAALAAAAGFAAVAVAPGNPYAVLAGAVLAGAATPPLEPCLRVLWPNLVGPELLGSAYALDAAAQELIFIGGPLVVAGAVALASPVAALWAGAALGVAGVLFVVTAPPSRDWRAPFRSTDWLGPLRSRALLLLLAGLTGAGVAIGTLNVLVVSYAEEHRVFGGAPALLALNALGAMIGALLYGTMRPAARPARRVPPLAAGLAGGYALLCLLPAPPLMACLMIVTGLFLAPLLTVTFALIGELAPRGTVTEAFAWLVTLITSGTALGSAAAGFVLEHASAPWAAACGAAGAAAGALLLFAGRRLLATGRDAATAGDVPETEDVPVAGDIPATEGAPENRNA